MKMAAIYARVSSDQQRDANTIASQTALLIEFARAHDLEVPKEWVGIEGLYAALYSPEEGPGPVADALGALPG